MDIFKQKKEKNDIKDVPKELNPDSIFCLCHINQKISKRKRKTKNKEGESSSSSNEGEEHNPPKGGNFKQQSRFVCAKGGGGEGVAAARKQEKAANKRKRKKKNSPLPKAQRSTNGKKIKNEDKSKSKVSKQLQKEEKDSDSDSDNDNDNDNDNNNDHESDSDNDNEINSNKGKIKGKTKGKGKGTNKDSDSSDDSDSSTDSKKKNKSSHQRKKQKEKYSEDSVKLTFNQERFSREFNKRLKEKSRLKASNEEEEEDDDDDDNERKNKQHAAKKAPIKPKKEPFKYWEFCIFFVSLHLCAITFFEVQKKKKKNQNVCKEEKKNKEDKKKKEELVKDPHSIDNLDLPQLLYLLTKKDVLPSDIWIPYNELLENVAIQFPQDWNRLHEVLHKHIRQDKKDMLIQTKGMFGADSYQLRVIKFKPSNWPEIGVGEIKRKHNKQYCIILEDGRVLADNIPTFKEAEFRLATFSIDHNFLDHRKHD
ncbi:hypothetical protein RFI_05862 [Reticulomyxa filosa]|uniref:Uncharacterized protein n=1 Tax=Reticulomyxa filosa TaxID=46433 RepID=X6P138_RETFI|nr:hypothetical protein RFI_05862 [Reticulomyxa filosa]|eukprot:ETO31262.1 hypothetical protein RFI_05862 [Reticulomyxa filosa]